MLAEFSSSSYHIRKTDGRSTCYFHRVHLLFNLYKLGSEIKRMGEECSNRYYSNAEATPLQTFQTVNSNAISWALTVLKSNTLMVCTPIPTDQELPTTTICTKVASRES
jgi:hypothetical protein